jgi:undecaprenyl diphosphate synthase
MTLIDSDNLPRHIAVIMDGNGRWAKQRSLGRVSGHRKGVEAVRRTVKTCRELAIDYLTLFAFSSENWLRPLEEVNALMALLSSFLDKEIGQLLKNDIRLVVIGDLSQLKPELKGKLDAAMAITAANKSMTLIIAVSYGGRDEIVRAVRKLAQEVQSRKLHPADVTPELLALHLDTAGFPDPDLLIRTGGEYRLSNFLLWQMAYTEFYFTPVFWPDFSRENLLEAIADYQHRQRRFGQVPCSPAKD